MDLNVTLSVSNSHIVNVLNDLFSSCNSLFKKEGKKIRNQHKKGENFLLACTLYQY